MTSTHPRAWDRFVGKEVVVDTTSNFMFIGTLLEVDEVFVTLGLSDVHNLSDGNTSKEKYTMDTKKYGLKPDRRSVSVLQERIVSVSKLEDVIEY